MSNYEEESCLFLPKINSNILLDSLQMSPGLLWYSTISQLCLLWVLVALISWL